MRWVSVAAQQLGDCQLSVLVSVGHRREICCQITESAGERRGVTADEVCDIRWRLVIIQ